MGFFGPFFGPFFGNTGEVEQPPAVELENAGGFIVAHPGSIAPSRRKVREILNAIQAAREGQRAAERKSATLRAGKAKTALRSAAKAAKEALQAVDAEQATAAVEAEIARLSETLKALTDVKSLEAIAERAREAKRVADELRQAALDADDDDEEAFALILMRWS
jgi:ribulose 1,5-bisphosphate carboxylase large subunit-like protein